MSANSGHRVAVLGAGSWGTTLAGLLADNGAAVVLWAYLKEEYEMLTATRERRDILPGYRLPSAVEITTDAGRAVSGAAVVFFVCPSAGVRDLARQVAGSTRGRPVVVSASKGLEERTGLRMTEVIEEEMGQKAGGIVAFTGPSHAEEVARRIPTAVVAASADGEAASLVRRLTMTPYFRVYVNDDVAGAEYGGALKNIVALAAGIVDGVGYGDNTKAALMTRGLAEMTRLGVRLGAREQTFAGLTGLGDLITTCMSRFSRNRHVGEEIGRGKRLEEVLGEMKMVAEGVGTTKTVYALAGKVGVEMPITAGVYAILFQDKDPREGIAELMMRKPKHERE